MKINVTQKDIDEGTKANCVRCPIALAVCRAMGYNVAKYVRVYAYSTAITVDQERRIYLLPEAAEEFILKFDKNETVKPFSFDLEDYEIIYVS